jgi:LacI family transcriptional regulator
VRGAEDQTSEEGFAIILCNSDRDRDRERKALELLEDKQVDGLISCSPILPDEELIPLVRQQAAVVVFDRIVDKAIAGSVRIDDVYGGISATNHLLKIGRRSLGLLAGPKYLGGSERRRYGFRAALELQGMHADPKFEIECEPDEEGGFEAAKLLFQRQPKLDGIFCFNDLVALGALGALNKLGISVPDQVAVIGFDDLRLASLTTPKLSTLRVDKLDLGRSMVRLLLERIRGDIQIEDEYIIRPKLIIRESAPNIRTAKEPKKKPLNATQLTCKAPKRTRLNHPKR